MRKAEFNSIDWYFIVDWIEVILLALGGLVNVIALFQTVKSNDVATRYLLGAAIFCIVISIQYVKVSILNKNAFLSIAKCIHNIDHELRNMFFEMFFEHQSKNLRRCDSITFNKECAQIVANNLSNTIHELYAAHIRVVIKLFDFENSELVFHSRKEDDIYLIDPENIKINTIARSVNGNTAIVPEEERHLSDYTLYLEALKKIATKDYFYEYNLEHYIKHFEHEQNKQFKYARANWLDNDKGVLIVGISDERSTWQKNKSSHSEILGMIKIVTSSKTILSQKYKREAVRDLVLATSDSLYKCIERQRYYYTLSECGEGAS